MPEAEWSKITFGHYKMEAGGHNKVVKSQKLSRGMSDFGEIRCADALWVLEGTLMLKPQPEVELNQIEILHKNWYMDRKLDHCGLQVTTVHFR